MRKSDLFASLKRGLVLGDGFVVDVCQSSPGYPDRDFLFVGRVSPVCLLWVCDVVDGGLRVFTPVPGVEERYCIADPDLSSLLQASVDRAVGSASIGEFDNSLVSLGLIGISRFHDSSGHGV